MKNRRTFFKQSSILTAGAIAAPLLNLNANTPSISDESIYLIGPQKGYSPHVGSLLSMMTMMRAWVVNQVDDLTVKELDFQLDDKSNSIGAMLMHLASTERYYQLNTFEDMEWGSWEDDEKIMAEWQVGMALGENARKEIKGNKIDFYLKKLEEVREGTKKGFAERDDEWLMKSAPFFGDEPTNNYCKWFHVCEHESNHNGQIKFLKKRFK